MKKTARTQRGISLVEVLIATALVIVAGVMISRVFVSANRGVNSSMSDFQVKSALTQLGGSMQRFMASGDTRFYGFSGITSGQAPYGTLARFFVPVPGACADLSNACPEDTAFLYIHYDKTVSPSVTAICRLDDTRWLVDTNNGSYGPNTLHPDTTGFLVTPPVSGTNFYPTGKVPVAAGQMLGLMNPPYVTIWAAGDKPQAVTLDYASVPMKVNTPSGALDMSPDCARGLGTTGNPTAGVYQVTVSPYVMGQFTVAGAAVPTVEEYRRLEGLFPMRLFSVEPRSVGRMPNPVSGGDAVLRSCTVAANVVSCAQTQQSVITGVRRFRVEMSFKLGLGGSAASRFELLGAGQTPACSSADCAELTLPAAGAIPVQWAIAPPVNGSPYTETYETITAAGFSFLKAETLARVRFRLQRERREEVIDVIFP